MEGTRLIRYLCHKIFQLEFLNQLALDYASQHSTPADPLLQELEDYTRSVHQEAHMLSGFLQGRFLSLFSGLLQPKRILEIGTFTGYSALCLAEGLGANGQLHTIEMRDADADIAQSFFDRSPLGSKIILHRGEAIPIIPTLNENWDLVFIDADKTSYTEYFNMVFSNLRSGGFILADNVFFHGQTFAPVVKGKNAKAIRAFNELVINRTDLQVLMLPLRDGLSLIQKK